MACSTTIRRRLNARLYLTSSGGRGFPRGLRRGHAPDGWTSRMPVYPRSPIPPTPSGSRFISRDRFSSLMSAHRPGTESDTSTIRPECSSTATWLLSVWAFFLPE